MREKTAIAFKAFLRDFREDLKKTTPRTMIGYEICSPTQTKEFCKIIERKESFKF